MKIKTRRYYLYYGAKILIFLISHLPRKICLAIAVLLGKSAFLILEKYRNKTIHNLDEAYGKDAGINEKIAQQVFINMAKNGAEWIKFRTMPKEDILSLVSETQGFEMLDNALKSGRGVIIVGSHFGNWELLLLYLSAIGYKGGVIARKIYFHKYDKIISSIRKRFGTKILYRDESPKKIFKLLKDGQVLGILADQDVDSVESVFVEYFGKETYTPVAPVKLAAATGAPVISGFMIRKKDDTYKLVFEEEMNIPTEGNKEQIVKEYTQKWTNVLEKYVREYPEQWVWMHARWKTRPS